jgi:hypothetical protein
MKNRHPSPVTTCRLAVESSLCRRPPTKSLILPLIIGFVTVAVSVNCLGQGADVPPFIKVDLEFLSSSYVRRGPNNDWITNTGSWSASVVIASNQWRIESGMPENATGLWFCDGTNVFYKADIHYPADIPNSPPLVAKNTGPSKNVVVIPGIHPMGDFGANLIWLAYCSGDYLQSTNRLLPLPGGEPRHDIRLFAVEDKTVLSASSPFLPANIEFLVNNANAANATEYHLVFRSVKRKPIPLRGINGAFAASYMVEQFTNYSGWTIPAAFKYAQTNFPEGLKASGVGYFVAGTVTKISETTAPKPLLENGKPSFVEDTRFRHPDRLVDSLRYTWTNTTLPATNDPAMLEALDQLAKKRPLIEK